jgi:hypothetical protein
MTCMIFVQRSITPATNYRYGVPYMSSAEKDFSSIDRMLQADGLPGVLLTNRPWRETAVEAVAHLARTKTPIYVRHGQLVRIQRKEDETPFIDDLNDTTLKGMVARAMNFVKINERGPRHVAPPTDTIKDMLTLGEWPFSPLDTLIEFPVFRPDGTLIETPGYDAQTKLLYVPLPSLTIPSVPAHPTDEDIVDALALIDEVVGEFPYENLASYANAVGLLLTPVIRHAIHGHVPLALIDATKPGTGKSLLAETVAITATGRKAAMMTAPYDDNEWRKRIASTLAEGATIITIDNVKAKIAAASLDAALTSWTVKERILGQSKNGVYAQRATWMATGNNIKIGGDLPRRSYWIRMNANSDRPWMRSGFKHDLEEWVPAHRGEIIAALLTLARAWFAAGRPIKRQRHMGSFQPWVDTVGGILDHVWLGDCPFLDNQNDLYEQADDEQGQWAAFLRVWHELYGEEGIMVAKLAKDIKSGSYDGGDTTLGVAGIYNALPEDLTDIAKGDFKRTLGKALSSRVGTQFDSGGLHLVKAGTDGHTGAVYWAVQGPEQQPQPDVLPDPVNDPPGSEHFSEPAQPHELEPLSLFDPVNTPRGEGHVIQNWPTRPGVKLTLTQEVVYFDNPQDIKAIRVLTSEPPDVWPYADPTLSDRDLLNLGYRSRAAQGYAMPRPYPDEKDW